MAVEQSHNSDAEYDLKQERQSEHATERQEALQHQRWTLLRHIDAALHKPLTALAFVWVGLLVVDFTHGLNTPLLYLTYAIWAIFGLDFLLEFVIAPNKLAYLRHHWLTAIALVLPGLRVLTIFRAVQALGIAAGVRASGLVRLVSSLNRGMAALSETLGRRGFGFVVAFTIIVIFAAAGAINYYENPAALHTQGYTGSGGLASYTDALWWTAMMITTIGSDYWPKTPEGRILTFLLALYAFSILGYITATLASFFVHTDAISTLGHEEKVQTRQIEQVKTVDAREVAALRAEIVALRAQMGALLARLDGSSLDPPADSPPPTSSDEPSSTDARAGEA